MTPAPKPESAPKSKRPAARLVLAVAGVALLAWCAHFGYRLFTYEETDDAQVAGHVHQVASQTDGIIRDVLAADNQVVAKGDVLATLDPLEFDLLVKHEEAALARARAEQARSDALAAQAQAQLTGSEARLAAANAEVTRAKVQLDLAGINAARARQLFAGGGAVTQADLDNAESALRGAEAAFQAAEANGKVAEATVIEMRSTVESTKAEALSARASQIAAAAAVADAQRKLSYATLTAPAAGRIGNRNAEAGNRVQAGQVLFALVEPDTWIVANFKETQIARMHPGQEVEVNLDALPGITLHGRVDSISPASGAQFALLPPDNATGNFTKVVQRVPVKVLLEDESARDAGDRLRPGLSAVVAVRVR
jgi:membrane fusion protein, multidrug efflux system